MRGTRALLLPALLLFSPLCPAEHITDRLLAGLYEAPSGEAAPLKALPSGTPVEILEMGPDFSRVRLGDDSTGWVENQYISSEKPARVMLLELQAKYSGMQQELQQAREEIERLRIGEDGTTGTDRAPASQPEAATSGTDAIRLQQLEQENSELRDRIGQAARLLGAEPDSPAAAVTDTDDLWPWYLALSGLALLASFIGGFLYKARRIARRMGGLRI